MSSGAAVEVPPTNDGDDDGHFPGLLDDLVKETISKLNHIPTRQWTYLAVARRARLVKPRGGVKDKARVPRQITSLLSDAEFRALTALVMYGNKDLSNSYPGLPKLAKNEKWPLRVLEVAVHQLVEKGWVTREGRSPLGTAVNQFYVPAGVLASWADEWKCPRRVKVEK
jgi:hypothetical protein